MYPGGGGNNFRAFQRQVQGSDLEMWVPMQRQADQELIHCNQAPQAARHCYHRYLACLT